MAMERCEIDARLTGAKFLAVLNGQAGMNILDGMRPKALSATAPATNDFVTMLKPQAPAVP